MVTGSDGLAYFEYTATFPRYQEPGGLAWVDEVKKCTSFSKCTLWRPRARRSRRRRRFGPGARGKLLRGRLDDGDGPIRY